MRFLFALLLCVASALGQVAGAPFGTGAVMFQYSPAAQPGGVLNTLAIVPGSAAAFCAQSLAPATPPALFPLQASAGLVYLDGGAAFLGVEPMVTVSLPGTDWGYLRAIPSDPAVVGLTVYTQCAAVLTSGSWLLTHGWATTIVP